MIVELDVFSGRPNPTWQLDETQARDLARRHRGLAATADRVAEPPGLGYRGFLYRLDGSAWRAWNGFVTTQDRALADPARSVERSLLGTLPTEFGDLGSRIATEIEPPQSS